MWSNLKIPKICFNSNKPNLFLHFWRKCIISSKKLTLEKIYVFSNYSKIFCIDLYRNSQTLIYYCFYICTMYTCLCWFKWNKIFTNIWIVRVSVCFCFYSRIVITPEINRMNTRTAWPQVYSIFIYKVIYIFIYLFIYLVIFLLIYIIIYIYIHLSLHLSINLLFIYIFIYLFTYEYIHQWIFIYHSSTYSFIYSSK